MVENYRLDIQGMRALAVVLVYLAHAGSSTFSGGFVGVDVFFVISGYVITQMLLKEGRLDSRRAFFEFFSARFKRLMPALVLMLTTTSLAIYWLLPAVEGPQQYRAAASAALWISNFFFLWSDTDYFGQGAEASAFLHTWSLGVEEQFYLLWPVVLALGLGAVPRAVGIDSKRFLFTLVSLSVASFTLCVWLSNGAGNQAFYLMPARAWQFGLGALVAYLHVTRGGLAEQGVSRLVFNSLGLLGLSSILAAAVLFSKHTPYPNWQVLVPSIGAALLLLSGYKNSLAWPNSALSFRPIRWLGDMSYSIYLWHWPALFFYWYLKPYYTQLVFWHPALATLALASLSYYLLENPVRRSRALARRPGWTIALATLLMVGFNFGAHQLLSSTEARIVQDVAGIARVKYQLPAIYRYNCDEWYASDRLVPCEVGEASPDKTAVMIGDSILTQWYPAIAAYYEERGWKLVVLTKSSCPMVNRSYYYQRIKSVFDICDTWRVKALQYIAEIGPDTVIIGSSARYPFSKIEWVDGTQEIFDELVPRVNQIKLIIGTPALPFNGPDCVMGRNQLSQLPLPAPSREGCSVSMAQMPSVEWIKESVSNYANVTAIDLNDAVCPDGMCAAEMGDQLVFRDHSHLSVGFVLRLKGQLVEALTKD